MEQPLYLWIIFLSLILGLLVFDLSLYGSKRKIKFETSLALSIFYIFLGLAFGGFIWWQIGANAAYEYYTGYLIEKTLSLDNIFIFSVIFAYLQIPEHNHHRVLFYGILGVIIFRGIMIGVGGTLIHQFEWILYIFGIILIATGIKLLRSIDQAIKVEDNYILRFLKRFFNISDDPSEHKFLIRKNKKTYLTPAFVALLMIETMDVIFAIDSIPAIFAITDDLYIVYTSNIFAILGLRALYFCLDGILDKFYYLKYSIAFILVLIGIKIFVTQIWGKIPSYISLSTTIMLLTAGVLYSMYKTSAKRR